MGSRPARHRYCRCGTHLAADNTEHQCARCQRATRDKLIAPPQVPAEFWHTEQLREAFTAQHIGRVARAYRMHPHHHAIYGPSGISQTLLGHWLGLRQPQISRIETGPPIRDLDTLAYWARVLRIPPRLLWFDLPGQTRQAALNMHNNVAVPATADEDSLELTTLLNSLTADRPPILAKDDIRGVGVAALDGASPAGRAEVLLKLFLQLDDKLGGDVLYLPLDLLAQKTPHRVRDRVHYLVRLARCYLLQHEVERACEVATEGVELSEATGSARVIERLGEFHVALDPFATSKPAQEFRELYVGAMVARSSVN